MFVFGNLFIGYAIWKYELFVLTPAKAAETILETMSDFLFLAAGVALIAAVIAGIWAMSGAYLGKVYNKGNTGSEQEVG